MSCICDQPNQIKGPDIEPGLDHIPLQIGGFPEFRAAMLKSLGNYDSLADWMARDQTDLGVMLLEFWAYICDVQSFYNEVHAQEFYLKTATQDASLSKLVGHLGYLPRPATAAAVYLALELSGTQPVTVPKGTAFQAAPFGDEGPQVFELLEDTDTHPLHNRFSLAGVPATTLAEVAGESDAILEVSSLLLEAGSSSLQTGQIAVVVFHREETPPIATKVKSLETVTEADGLEYDRVEFEDTLQIHGQTPLAHLAILTPRLKSGLWSKTEPDPSLKVVSDNGKEIILDSLNRNIRAGDTVVVTSNDAGTISAHVVESTIDEPMIISVGGPTQVEDADGDWVNVELPEIKQDVTQVTLEVSAFDGAITSGEDSSKITVHHGLTKAGAIARPSALDIDVSNDASFGLETRGPRRDAPNTQQITDVVLVDSQDQAAKIPAQVNLAQGEIQFGETETDAITLAPPLTAYGNLLYATRGESITNEILGSGDGTLTNQSFKFKSGPLTYVPAPGSGDERGVASTLNIRVNGILWTEVPTFFEAGPDDTIFIVRHSGDDATVTFGDGEHGVRLPTGIDNIIAEYRFGAGAAVPPAASITQAVEPVEQITALHQPLDAFGGSDAETDATLRSSAPKTALLIGRAISLDDLQAAASVQPGVVSATAGWHWHERRQMPVAQIWYIGNSDLAPDIHAVLSELSDPNTPLSVEAADAMPLTVSFQVDPIPLGLESDAIAETQAALLDPDTGFLADKNIGIGHPIFRSQLVERIQNLPSVGNVSNISVNGEIFKEVALKGLVGSYYTVSSDHDGALIINGQGGAV